MGLLVYHVIQIAARASVLQISSVTLALRTQQQQCHSSSSSMLSPFVPTVEIRISPLLIPTWRNVTTGTLSVMMDAAACAKLKICGCVHPPSRT